MTIKHLALALALVAASLSLTGCISRHMGDGDPPVIGEPAPDPFPGPEPTPIPDPFG